MSETGNPRALSGVRVVDLTRLFPGPFCTMLLADLGADVIKVESPQGGDYARWFPPNFGSGPDSIGAFFAALNRGKRSVALDLKGEADRAAFLRLVETADVVVESFRPGVMARLGLGADVLAEHRPDVITCSVSGYGQTGPMRDRAGHDLNYIALGGALDQTGPRGGSPHPPGFQLADVAGGALYAALAIVSALYHRLRTGRGSRLDISMADGALTLLAPVFARITAGAEPPVRGADQLTGGLPAYSVYPTADGKFMSLAALEPKFWTTFCNAVDRPDWLSHGHTYDSPVRDEIAALFRTKTRDEWIAFFDDLDAMCEPVLSPAEVLDSELARAREIFFTLVRPDGTGTLQTATPVTPRRGRLAQRPPPLLGEHTEEVLRELGLRGDL